MLNAEDQWTREKLLEKALQLDVEDRVFLAEALEDSLHPTDFATPAAVEEKPKVARFGGR